MFSRDICRTKRGTIWPGRSVVMSTNGMVATSQPLAALAGVQIMMSGGNAADAAVAAAALLNVVEPMSTGLGGDAFAIAYDVRKGELRGLNASGRSPYKISLEAVREMGFKQMPTLGMLPVTVPGTLDGWVELLRECGTKSLEDVLQPAIRYAEEGFPATEVIGREWEAGLPKLRGHPTTAANYLVEGRPPRVGEVFRQPNLAKTFKLIAQKGRDAFYGGEIARKIVDFSEENGGFLALKDFEDHTSTWVEPIKTDYRGYEIYELPPNCQGIAALIALNIVEQFDLAGMEHNSPEYLHILIEAKKLAFADRDRYVADPEFARIPVEELLSKDYARERAKSIGERASECFEAGAFPRSGDTVYLTAVDGEGNAVSFINSLFEGFGSGMVVPGTGIALQNRGALFSLDPNHPNRLEPHKRPLHTIIPAMIFKGGKPLVSFGVMGGHMQPQGHLQFVANLVDFGMNVQEAIEAPRFCHFSGREVGLEGGIPEGVRKGLRDRGHIVLEDLGPYGGGQAIMIDPETGVLMGGSDYRKDGCAIGY
ncbi:MAG: gamma-glutamyltransferase [bacterium]